MMETSFKGGSWEYVSREEGIQIVNDMSTFCEELGLTS